MPYEIHAYPHGGDDYGIDQVLIKQPSPTRVAFELGLDSLEDAFDVHNLTADHEKFLEELLGKKPDFDLYDYQIGFYVKSDKS